MFKFEIENNVLKKISVEEINGYFVEKEEGFTCNWGTYIVKVPDGVEEIGENIFDESCNGLIWGAPGCYVRAIYLPYTIKKVADNAFNLPNIIIYIEEENSLLYNRFNNPWLGHEELKKELEKNDNTKRVPNRQNSVAQEAPLMTLDIHGNWVPLTEALIEEQKMAANDKFGHLVPVTEALNEDIKDETKEREFDTVTFDEESFSKEVKEDYKKDNIIYVRHCPSLAVLFRLYAANQDLGDKVQLKRLFSMFMELSNLRCLSQGSIESEYGCCTVCMSYDKDFKLKSIVVHNPRFHYNAAAEANKGLSDIYAWVHGQGPIDFDYIRRLVD
jgi:hypothetical protein